MWAERLTTWVQTVKTLLTKPPSETDFYPNDRLPSEQVIGDFALRGYRGPTLLISAEKYFDAKQADLWIYEFNKGGEWRGLADKFFVERDVQSLTELVERCDAVRVRPAY